MEEAHSVKRIWRFTLIWEKEFYLRVLAIMVPVILQQAINMGVNMLDTMMLGSFGEIQLSGSSLANTFYNLFTIGCMGILGGIGFTMSILIAGLAFTEIPAELLAAKTAILAGSVSAAVIGLAFMALACRDKEPSAQK